MVESDAHTHRHSHAALEAPADPTTGPATSSDAYNNEREGAHTLNLDGEAQALHPYDYDKAAHYDGAGNLHHEAIGDAGEERVQAVLQALVGPTSRGVALKSAGTDHLPDLTLSTPRGSYAIEVKTTLPYRKQGQEIHAGGAKLNRQSWEGVTKWAKSKGFKRLLVVEVRIRGSSLGHLYHVIPGAVVDWALQQTQAEWIHFSLYDLPALASFSFRPGRPLFRRPPL